MTVEEFLRIEDAEDLKKVEVLKKVIVSKNGIGQRTSESLMKLPYALVNEVRRSVNTELVKCYCLLLNCTSKWILKQDYKDFLYFLKWMEDELHNIFILEQNLAKKEPEEMEEEMKLEQCGVDRLSAFEEINIIDSLANGDVLKWEEVEKLPYEVVYTKLLKNKIDASIRRRYTKLEESIKAR